MSQLREPSNLSDEAPEPIGVPAPRDTVGVPAPSVPCIKCGKPAIEAIGRIQDVGGPVWRRETEQWYCADHRPHICFREETLKLMEVAEAVIRFKDKASVLPGKIEQLSQALEAFKANSAGQPPSPERDA